MNIEINISAYIDILTNCIYFISLVLYIHFKGLSNNILKGFN